RVHRFHSGSYVSDITRPADPTLLSHRPVHPATCSSSAHVATGVESSPMNRGLMLGRRLTAGAAALGLLAGTGLVVTPAAMQRRAGASLQTVNVTGHPAAPGEVLVKFRRSLAASERGVLDQQADADRDDAIGHDGVRRMHSRRDDTPALLAFLQTH